MDVHQSTKRRPASMQGRCELISIGHESARSRRGTIAAEEDLQ
jgi:hypothetical protein